MVHLQALRSRTDKSLCPNTSRSRRRTKGCRLPNRGGGPLQRAYSVKAAAGISRRP